jgi:hypothetical protein
MAFMGGPPEGTSSTGRASVSKTEGWGFKSLVPCKILRSGGGDLFNPTTQ